MKVLRLIYRGEGKYENLYTKQEIEAISAHTNFIKGNIEKVIRLIDVLSYINETFSSAGRFALKGGTAINLCVLNIPRLSVDIDLDFAQNLSKEETEEFRLTFKVIFTNRN